MRQLDTTGLPPKREPTDLKGLAAARAVAGWELGDPSWADMLIRAYLNPELAQRELVLEKDDTP